MVSHLDLLLLLTWPAGLRPVTSLAPATVEESSGSDVFQTFELVEHARDAVSTRPGIIQQFAVDVASTTDPERNCVETQLLGLRELGVVTVWRRVVSCRGVLRLDSLSETELARIQPHSRLHIIVAWTWHIFRPCVDPLIMYLLIRTVR